MIANNEIIDVTISENSEITSDVVSDSDLDTISMSSVASYSYSAQSGETTDILWQQVGQMAHRVGLLNSTDIELLYVGHDKPPVQIRKVIEAAAIMLGLQPVKSRRGRQFMIVSLKAAKKILQDDKFLDNFLKFAEDANTRITTDGLRALKNYITDPLMSPDLVERESTTALVMWMYIRAVFAYSIGAPIDAIIEAKKHERKKSLNKRRAMSPEREKNNLIPHPISPRKFSKATSHMMDDSDLTSDNDERREARDARRKRLAEMRSKREARSPRTTNQEQHRSRLSSSDSINSELSVDVPFDPSLPSYMRPTSSSRNTKTGGNADKFYGGLRKSSSSPLNSARSAASPRRAVSPRRALSPSRQKKRVSSARRRKNRSDISSNDVSSINSSRQSSRKGSASMDDFKRQMDELNSQFETEMDTAFSMLSELDQENSLPSYMQPTSSTKQRLEKEKVKAKPKVKQLKHASFMESTTAYKLKLAREEEDEEEEEKKRKKKTSTKQLDWAEFMRPTTSRQKHLEPEKIEELIKPKKRIDQMQELKWASFMRETASYKQRLEPEMEDTEEMSPRKRIDPSKIKEVEWASFMQQTESTRKRTEVEEEPEVRKPVIPAKPIEWAPYMKSNTLMDYRSGKKEVPKSSGWSSSTAVEKAGGILAQFELKSLAAKRKEQAAFRARRSKSMGINRRPLYTPPTIPESNKEANDAKISKRSHTIPNLMVVQGLDSRYRDELGDEPSLSSLQGDFSPVPPPMQAPFQRPSTSRKHASKRNKTKRPKTARKSRSSDSNTDTNNNNIGSPKVPRAFLEWEKKKKQKEEEKLRQAEAAERKRKKVLASIQKSREARTPRKSNSNSPNSNSSQQLNGYSPSSPKKNHYEWANNTNRKHESSAANESDYSEEEEENNKNNYMNGNYDEEPGVPPPPSNLNDDDFELDNDPSDNENLPLPPLPDDINNNKRNNNNRNEMILSQDLHDNNNVKKKTQNSSDKTSNSSDKTSTDKKESKKKGRFSFFKRLTSRQKNKN